MAEETNKPDGNAEPPKIKLNGGSKPPSSEGTPPRMSIRPGDRKAETARIDLASAQPPSAISEEAKADFFKRATIRIDQPTMARKSETQKVKPETQKIKPDTQRLDVDPSKQTTMRVEVDQQQKKRETARLDISSADIAKRQTAKFDTTRVAPPDTSDVFKRTTMPIGVPTPPPPSAAKPPTIQSQRPKTMQVKRPASTESAITQSPEAAEAAMEAKKSETARIDLPADVGERPPTRPKTIRIKRPDGTSGRKALTIARPAAEDEVTVSPRPAEVAAAFSSDDSPGTLYSLLALVAVLVVVVLTYVLAAQTIAADLPFPGRI